MTDSSKVSAIKSELTSRYALLSKALLGKEVRLCIPIFPDDMGRHHFEFRHDGLISMIWTERGREIKRLSTFEIDEVLYWLFREVVKGRAIMLELKNRKKSQCSDRRQIWFPIAVQEMSKLSKEWGGKLSEEFDFILRESPFKK